MTTHNRASIEMTPRIASFDLVGNLSQSILDAKIETFKGTYLCQINPCLDEPEHAPEMSTCHKHHKRNNPPIGSKYHCHTSEMVSCKETVSSNALHSPSSTPLAALTPTTTNYDTTSTPHPLPSTHTNTCSEP